jgi:hypothetical protein
MLDFPAAHRRRTQSGGCPIGRQFCHLHRETPVRPAGTREQRLHRRSKACPGSRRPGHQKRRRPAGELAIQYQEGQPAEMITMQVRHRHRIDRVRGQALRLGRYQAGGAAVDQQHLPLASHVNTRLPASTTTERVTAAHKPDPHDSILTHPLQNSSCQHAQSGMTRWLPAGP